MKAASVHVLVAIASITSAISALAQNAGSAARLTVAPAAKLMVVTEGVFDLSLGRSIDLTDKKLLLTFPRDQNWNSDAQFNMGRLLLTINGRTTCPSGGSCNIPVGRRIVLQDFSDKLGDRGECFLDVVELHTPKGAQPTVTLRLHCP